jgi:hypothetical protein
MKMNEQELGTTPRSESMTQQINQTTQQTTQDPIDLLSPEASHLEKASYCLFAYEKRVPPCP